MKKATLEELLARKEQAAAAKTQFKDIEVPSLGLVFTVQKLPLAKMLSILDGMDEAEGISGKFEQYKEIIFHSVPLFQQQKLLDAYDLAEPYDIVPAVLEDNLAAIGELGDGIVAMYGLDDKEKLKK